MAGGREREDLNGMTISWNFESGFIDFRNSFCLHASDKLGQVSELSMRHKSIEIKLISD